MGKVLYSATMSLDGYIAGPDGDMSWLAPYLGPNPQVEALQLGIGALLIGGRTFRGDDPKSGYAQRGSIQRNVDRPVSYCDASPAPRPGTRGGVCA
jgi:riboflavin biosynthesis pyrimidine reductase